MILNCTQLLILTVPLMSCRILDNIYSWSVEWQLNINISKCCTISIYNGRRTVTNIHKYFINGHPLENTYSVSDLGVKIDSHLTFRDHINGISARAMQRVGILFRGFSSRNFKLLRSAFITYIRPILEFNSTVWNPTRKYLITQIEKVQRSFTKRIPTLTNLSYSERLSALNLEPLELRRLRFDLIYYYKIFNNLTPLSPTDYFNMYVPPSASRTPMPIIQKPQKASKKLMSSCFYRAIDAWNSLSPSIRNADSLPKFKNALLNLSSDLLKFCNVFS